MGDLQVSTLNQIKMKTKKNGRYAKSLLRIGFDALQNIIPNLKIPAKGKQFNLLINLLSCA